QAEDGIRDRNVTGVQTCALPISSTVRPPGSCSAAPASSRTSPAGTASSCPISRCSTRCGTRPSARSSWACARRPRCDRTSTGCPGRSPTRSGSSPMAESITDALLHLWDLSGGGYGWLAGAPAGLRRAARCGEAATQPARVDAERGVLVQAAATRAATAAMQEAAARIEAGPGPVARADVVAWLPLAEPARTAEILADPHAMRHVVGVRHLVHDDPDPGFLDRPEVRESLALLAEWGLTLD